MKNLQEEVLKKEGKILCTVLYCLLDTDFFINAKKNTLKKDKYFVFQSLLKKI